mgnify:CR=1 FL=1
MSSEDECQMYFTNDGKESPVETIASRSDEQHDPSINDAAQRSEPLEETGEDPGILCETPPILPEIPGVIATPLECDTNIQHGVSDLQGSTIPCERILRRSSRNRRAPLWHQDYVMPS